MSKPDWGTIPAVMDRSNPVVIVHNDALERQREMVAMAINGDQRSRGRHPSQQSTAPHEYPSPIGTPSPSLLDGDDVHLTARISRIRTHYINTDGTDRSAGASMGASHAPKGSHHRSVRDLSYSFTGLEYPLHLQATTVTHLQYPTKGRAQTACYANPVLIFPHITPQPRIM